MYKDNCIYVSVCRYRPHDADIYFKHNIQAPLPLGIIF